MGIDLVDAAWMGEHIEGCVRSASNGKLAAALQEVYLCGNIYLGRNRWNIFGSEIGRGPASLMVYSLLHFSMFDIIPDANSQTSPHAGKFREHLGLSDTRCRRLLASSPWL